MMRNASRQSKKRFGAALSIIAVLAALWGIDALSGRALSSVVRSAAAPVWEARNALATVPFSSLFSEKSELEKQIQELSRENTRLRISLLSETAKSARTEGLSAAAGSATSTRLVAHVLVWPPQTPYGTLTIDIGERAGATEGARVVSPGGAALGVIAETFGNTSSVSLFSSSGVETQGVLHLPDESVAITLTGRGGGMFEARVPRGLSAGEGAVVTLPGADAFVLGIVESVKVDPSDPFALLRVARPIADRSITVVGIETERF